MRHTHTHTQMSRTRLDITHPNKTGQRLDEPQRSVVCDGILILYVARIQTPMSLNTLDVMFIEARGEHSEECNICGRCDSDRIRVQTCDNFLRRDNFPCNNGDLRVGERVSDDCTRSPKIGRDLEQGLRGTRVLPGDDEKRASTATGQEVLLAHGVHGVRPQVVQVHVRVFGYGVDHQSEEDGTAVVDETLLAVT